MHDPRRTENIHFGLRKEFTVLTLRRKSGVGWESMVVEPKMMFVAETGKTKVPPTLAIASYAYATRFAGCRSSRIGEGERTRMNFQTEKKESSNGTVAKQRRGRGCMGYRKDIRVAEVHHKTAPTGRYSAFDNQVIWLRSGHERRWKETNCWDHVITCYYEKQRRGSLFPP